MQVRPLPDALDKEIRLAVCMVLDCDPNDIFLEDDGRGIYVNWSESMTARDRWDAVKAAVRNVLPPTLRDRIITVT